MAGVSLLSPTTQMVSQGTSAMFAIPGLDLQAQNRTLEIETIAVLKAAYEQYVFLDMSYSQLQTISCVSILMTYL